MNALGQRLPAYSLFAAVIAAAGLPIYIYAPKYYADTYGVSLTALGALLFALRLFDVVQDPVLGWISERLRAGKAFWVSMGAVLLAVSMWGLFAVDPLFNPIWWFGLTITGLFTAFSFLTINFYAQGVVKASARGVVIHRDHGLALDAIGFAACGFVHHPVDGDVLAAGYGFEELEEAQYALSSSQVGLGLRGGIGRVRPEDVVAVTASALDRLHGFTTPGVAFLKSTFFEGLIVHLLDEFYVFIHDGHVEAGKGDDMGARLTGVFAEAFES